MKRYVRAFLLGVGFYTLAVSYFLWPALFSSEPKDSVIFIAFSSLPSSILTKALPPWSQIHELIAAILRTPSTDRLGIRVDAILFWLVGCVQYGLLSVGLARLASDQQPSGA